MRVVSLLFCFMVFCGAAFGYSVTLSGSAELGSTEAIFSNTVYSPAADTVSLVATGEAKWSPASGITVRATTVDADGVTVAPDGNGGAIFTWKEEYEPGKSRFIGAWYDTNGSVLYFSPETYATVKTDEAIDLVKSTDGNIIDGVLASVISLDPSNKQRVQAIKSTGISQVLWNNRVSDAPGEKQNPHIASDNAGGAYAVWKDLKSGPSAICVQKLNHYGTPEWTTGGITLEPGVATHNKTPLEIVPLGDSGAAVVWIDHDNSANLEHLNSRLISPSGAINGHIDAVTNLTARKGQNGVAIADAARDAVVVLWTENNSATTGDIYVQKMAVSGSDLVPSWGATPAVGLPLDVRVGAKKSTCAVAHSNGDTTVNWGVLSGATVEGRVQRVSSSGALLLGANAISLGGLGMAAAVTNEAEGVCGSSITSGGNPYIVGGESLSAAGGKLWGAGGVAVTGYPLDVNNSRFAPVAASGRGVILAWTDLRSGRRGIYAQKIEDAYLPSGVYISKKLQNVDAHFGNWATALWSVSSGGTVAVELRTAATSTDLDSAAWAAVSYGGSIPSNGRWLQARVTFTRGAADTTASLSSLTFNYNIDSAGPTIGATEVGGVKLIEGEDYPVDASPTITVTATDDVAVTAITGEVDGTPMASSLGAAGARAQATATFHPTIAEGRHTMSITAFDEAGNTATKSYYLVRSNTVAVSGGVALATAADLSQGQSAAIAYTLTAPANIDIEIRDITGMLVKRISCPASTTGAVTGYNEVAWDGRDGAGAAMPKGIYPFIIVSSGRQLAAGRIMVK